MLAPQVAKLKKKLANETKKELKEAAELKSMLPRGALCIAWADTFPALALVLPCRAQHSSTARSQVTPCSPAALSCNRVTRNRSQHTATHHMLFPQQLSDFAQTKCWYEKSFAAIKRSPYQLLYWARRCRTCVVFYADRKKSLIENRKCKY